jgi:hypothetical protein
LAEINRLLNEEPLLGAPFTAPAIAKVYLGSAKDGQAE